MRVNYSEYQNEIDLKDMTELWELIEELEVQYNQATQKAKDLIVKARDTQAVTNTHYARAVVGDHKIADNYTTDKRASEKANREMRSFHRREIEPLQEKLVRARVLFKTKFGDKWVSEMNRCLDCGADLPAPVKEDRDGGYSELITYCKCGTTYTSK